MLAVAYAVLKSKRTPHSVVGALLIIWPRSASLSIRDGCWNLHTHNNKYNDVLNYN